MSLKPAESVPTWKHRTAYERVWRCTQMLYLHGFLSDAEYKKAIARIKKWEYADPPPGKLEP